MYSRTREYAVEVAEAALSSFHRQARGTLQAPDGDENVRLYTAKGGSAVTLSASTTSAAVVFDPEASLRTGQMNVLVYGRNSAGLCNEVKSVSLGRATTEFISAGVLSSGLKVLNSSGVDVIAGTQTAAVLTSVPRDVSKITSTDVANSCSNHERDLVSGVVSRDDATATISFTEHFGKKMCLARANTTGNVIRRTWDDGVGTRRTTVGSTLGQVSNVDLLASVGNDLGGGETGFTDIEIASSDLRMLLDTNRLDSNKNPLTLATYGVEVTGIASLTTATSGKDDTLQLYKFVLIGLDATGSTVVARQEITKNVRITTNEAYDVEFNGTLQSDNIPIARVVVGVRTTQPDISEVVVAANSTYRVTAIEETADIAARPIHVCVLEGLNASATLNLTSTALLTGVPDSTNVFIASGTTEQEVHDSNAVQMFLKSVSRSLPRAFTVHGHQMLERQVKAVYDGQEMELAFKAMSFSDIGKKFKGAARVAKSLAKDGVQLIEDVAPIAEMAGKGMSMLPGPVGMAGTALEQSMRRLR